VFTCPRVTLHGPAATLDNLPIISIFFQTNFNARQGPSMQFLIFSFKTLLIFLETFPNEFLCIFKNAFQALQTLSGSE
jgi:hypothetical protein